MLRFAPVLVVVSACASSAPMARAIPSVPDARSTARTAAPRVAAPEERSSRLAPPFGPTAGVRRVSETSVAADPDAAVSDVVAAALR